MLLRFRHRAVGAAASWVLRPLLAGVCVMALAGCGPDGGPGLVAGQPSGATVAFESIDGPPPAQFKELVKNLNVEAQARRLAVTSRDAPSAYRVRGYLAAAVAKGKTTISWVWDVFDRDEHRVLRVAGAQTERGRHRDAWSVADDAMLQHIAHSSMDQIAAFLTSPAVVPGAPGPAPAPAQVALIGDHPTTPEEAGIFRIFKPRADPKLESAPETEPAPGRQTAAVPLPRSRPAKPAAVSSLETVTLAASSRADGR
jgi:hypothetical protein